MAGAIVASEERGKWHCVRDERTGDVCITNPAGTEYEISAPRLSRLERDVGTLLDDMLNGLIDIQNENEALRSRDELRDRAEGQSAFDLQAQVEALKAARAADKAGFEAVIRELREEVARLKKESQGALLSGVADIAHCGGLAMLSEADAITAIRKLTLAQFKNGRSVDQMKMDVLAALRAEGEAK